MTKRVAILGSTGSIGTQTLDIVKYHPEEYKIEALAAGHNTSLLLEQVRQFSPKKVSVATKELADGIRNQLPSRTKLLYGKEGLLEIAADSEAGYVVSALVGSQGLEPTLAAIKAGKDIGLANKETLVTAGHIVTDLIEKHKISLFPIDSEHSAIFQCLNGESLKEVSRIILTASGGSFRDRTRDELSGVTVEEALQHPNWTMGAKVTIDSATMANKGLEVIEAHWLFNMPYSQIEVVVHPQSIIHSLVEFADFSMMAQMGHPDMRVPIQYALSYPNRSSTPTKPLNLVDVGRLDFHEMDFSRYPCLGFAYESGKIGGSAPTVFNAANEVAVSRFINGEIQFLEIESVIYQVLERHKATILPTLEEIFIIDQWARKEAASVLS